MFGGMTRLLFLAFLIWLGWVLWRRVKALLDATGTASRGPSAGSPQQLHMLRCEHCGLHVPEHEAVRALNGHVYCCEDHRRLAGD